MSDSLTVNVCASRQKLIHYSLTEAAVSINRSIAGIQRPKSSREYLDLLYSSAKVSQIPSVCNQQQAVVQSRESCKSMELGSAPAASKIFSMSTL